MIEIRNCSKAFGEIHAIDHVSMEIGERQIFGLVGTNGAGKSTLLRMAAGVIKPDEGEILAGSYKDSIGRSYYAMFTAVRALLAVEGQDFSKHAGVIAYFQKEYVKTGKFDKKYSKYISQAFQIRNNTDYADFFLVSLQDAKEQYDRAEEFVKVIEEFLKME